MSVLSHVAGVPVEELLAPLLATGMSGVALIVRTGLRRRRAQRPARRALARRPNGRTPRTTA